MRTLLQKLENPPPPGERNLPDNLEEAVRSIRKHLQAMLNTRHDGSETVPDFGTCDFSDIFRGSRELSRLRDDIMRSISLYEPRLRNVQVKLVEDEEKLTGIHFDVRAEVVTEEGQTPTVFRTVVETTGAVTVR